MNTDKHSTAMKSIFNNDERRETFVKQGILVFFLVQKENPVKALLEAKKCIFLGKIKGKAIFRGKEKKRIL